MLVLNSIVTVYCKTYTAIEYCNNIACVTYVKKYVEHCIFIFIFLRQKRLADKRIQRIPKKPTVMNEIEIVTRNGVSG